MNLTIRKMENGRRKTEDRKDIPFSFLRSPFSILHILRSATLILLFFDVLAQETQMRTYCNPINLDYTYMIYNAHRDLSYRSGADPAVVEFRDEYYMFVTRSMGYWHSTDLLNWRFIKPQQWYFEGSNAPAAFNYQDSLLYVAGNPSGAMSVLYSDRPAKGEWQATPAILTQLQDPALFIDDDRQGYIFWGSSNKFPIRARTLDVDKNFRPSEEVYELFNLEPEQHGWERFGENHADTILGGYIEGPWMTKYNDKYYLQYAAPGTEFNVYGDGVYISDNPLGPYEYAPNNPFSYKPGGFINGAGHGSTVKGPLDIYWHFATMAVAINIGWERRIGMFPTFFDEDGLMYSDTYFGDYPHFAPAVPGQQGGFAGWMLLSYQKPVTVSSSQDNYSATQAVDENVKTYWLAQENNDEQWLEIDLETPATVYAIQVNFADHQAGLYGKVSGLQHRYWVEGSADGESWEVLVDRKNSYEDTPNDYVELSTPQKYRYIRYRNIQIPTPYLAISGLRVFGKSDGKVPHPVKGFSVQRKTDRRDAVISWKENEAAQGYNVLWGIAPDKLYSSWLLYDETQLELKSLNVDQTYYFSVEAFNENGVSERLDVIKVE
ncbi:family 43 glycosylhydrolase [Tunicatimonas pelagia]|uniref:family 43 glycosylhydrolase n=1 Tax=Tunicatimonas pelagia TaxID=931531 RepID=UPI002665F063|nr:family 43 glycosylhydrolase [Tunicatimonas pelagia]WKN43677.1 family 43 glycosylhydrolase [Tunicatimonas pelagia]